MRRRIATARVDGAELELLEAGRGADFCLAFDGPSGLEWSFEFDDVRVEANLIRLLRVQDRAPPRTVGTLEGAASVYGDVGERLTTIAEDS